jgi:hypothetical protein
MYWKAVLAEVLMIKVMSKYRHKFGCPLLLNGSSRNKVDVSTYQN